MDASSIRTFLAANTPNGFKSVFEPFLEGKTTYIIKGGPGTGKSGLMKKIAAEAVRRGEFAELIHCSSDPESLDGVYIPSRNVAICDGTAPHTLDPKYPGAAGGIIDLGRFWDPEGAYGQPLGHSQPFRADIGQVRRGVQIFGARRALRPWL